jgi:fructokinase
MTTQTTAVFGEVLFDCFIDGPQVLGGAPFNVAWHLQALGVRTDFISRLGHDHLSEDALASMTAWGMNTALVQRDAHYPTGKVTISLQQGEPTYAILDQQAYDFIDEACLTRTRPYTFIYHGSLALRHQCAEQALTALLHQHLHAKIFFDVNLRAPWWQKHLLHAWLKRADWLKVNEEEFYLLAPERTSFAAMMKIFLDYYHLEGLVVTLGEQGAVALTHTAEWVEVSPSQVCKIVDTVGAGDAFAAVVLLGLQQGWSLNVLMTRAQDFAQAIVQQRGAIVHERQFYQVFLKDWGLN